MLSYKDKKILDSLEQFKFLTLKQIAYLHFPHNGHCFHYARIKIRELEKEGLVKSSRFEGLKVCHIEDDININYHRLVLLDFYSTLIYNNIKVLDYKFEYHWLNGKRKSDGIFMINYEGVKQVIVCEIDYTHKTEKQKYEDIYNSQEAQNKFGIFPHVFIINRDGKDYGYKYSDEINDYIYYLDFELIHFNRVLAVIS